MIRTLGLLVSIALIACLATQAAVADDGTTQTRYYTVGLQGAPVADGFGLTHFPIDPEGASVRITIEDDLFSGVGGWYFFQGGQDVSGFFCQSSTVAIPDDATSLAVSVGLIDGASAKGCPNPASTGKVTITPALQA